MSFLGADGMPVNRQYHLLLNIRVAFTMLLLLLGSACDLELLKPTLRVPFTTKLEFELDSLQFKSDLVLIYEETSKIDIDSLIRHYEGNPEQIKNASVKSITLTVVEPEEISLGFLENSYVSILSSNLAETTLAEETDENAADTEITYTLTAQAGNILDYISDGDFYTLRIYGMFASPIPVSTVELLLEVRWEIAVAPF